MGRWEYPRKRVNYMALKPCPRCKRLIPVGVQYCPDCKPIAAAAWEETREHNARLRQRQYNRRRDTTGEVAKFRRSEAWRRTSKAKLQACGYKCEAKLDQKCGRIACEVHHIKPLKTAEGWEARLDWENLMGVCVHCHNILDGKTFKRRDDGVIDLQTIKR